MAEEQHQHRPGIKGLETCAVYQEWISGYLDGELDAESRRELESHILGCAVCRREYESMKRLVIGTSAAFAIEDPPGEVWDTFLDGVYNRLERKTGWVILLSGTAVLLLYAIFLFFTEPWGSMISKILVAAPVVGLIMLFISVLRQRLRTAKTDRYSKEVYR